MIVPARDPVRHPDRQSAFARTGRSDGSHTRLSSCLLSNLFSVLCTLLTAMLVPACAPGAGEPSGQILVGAIRWDAWHRPSTDTVHGGYGGPVKAVEYSLSRKQYQTRAPFFARILSDSAIRIEGYTREVVDSEIAYAKEAGLDYWAFLLYPTGNVMSQGIGLYLSSEHRRDVDFCVMATTTDFNGRRENPDGIPRLLRMMEEPGYVKVQGGRPLLYFFRPDEEWVNGVGGPERARGLVDSLRIESIRLGAGDPYLVVMHYDPEVAARMAGILGAQALSEYAEWGDGGHNGTPYTNLTEAARSFRDSCAATGYDVVPLATTGWNRLPRIERPVPWERAWQEPGQGMDRYFALPNPDEIAEHVLEECNWIRNHPDAAPASTLLIYAWNEHDEGGWLCPTINRDGSINDSRIRALAGIRDK